VADTAKARRRGNSARRADEARWCLEQRLKSRSYPEIARASATEFGRKLSQTAVFRRVQDGIEGLVKEPSEQVPFAGRHPHGSQPAPFQVPGSMESASWSSSTSASLSNEKTSTWSS
jgi:hypothetical protein